MLERFLEEYINDLYEKQNNVACFEQKNLFTKKDYYELLKPVIEMLKAHKSYTMEEMREYLFKQSKIEEKVRDFIYQKEMSPGTVFSYGTKNYRETVVVGNRQEVTLDQNGNLVLAIEKMTEDTIFDLASVTKIFTSLSVLKLLQNGSINLVDKITKYVPEFKNLNDVSIFDLISFRVPLKTNGRVDRANSKEEAEQILFNIEVDKESNNRRPYTDMGAMVLKYVIEKVSGMNYYQFIDENILKHLKMENTHVVVPKMKLNRVASTNLDTVFYKDGNVVDKSFIQNGIVYDEKARIMGQSEGNLSGHAGIFSTAEDMTSLAKGIINGKIIDSEYVEMMSKNRTGKKYIEDRKEKYIQYLGFLCYSKNPILADSELFHAMSGKAFASAGWTGTQLTVDPINQLYLFLGSNRSHNRVSIVDPAQRQNIQYDENGKGVITLPNGRIKTTSYKYAWDRDAVIIHPALKLAIQYKMLEDLYSYDKELKDEEKHYVKYI